MLKKWNPFADSYMIRNLDVIVVGERNVEDPIMAYNIDLTWDGSFQIWKNTPDNHHFIRQWIGITRSIFYTSVWTKNYPYEMGAFQNVFLRDWLTHYHCIIEMREGQDAYGFLSIDSSLTVNQSLSLMNVDLMEESLFLDLSDVYKEYQRIPEAWILTNYERYDPNNNIIIVSTMYVDHAYSILYSDFHNQKPSGDGEIRRRGGAGGGNEGGGRNAQQNSQGILRFYTDDAPGFQIGPTTVLACSLMFIGAVVLLHIFGKFTS
eukprot:gene9838-10682_t